MSPEYDALRQIRSKNVPVVKTDIGGVLKAARLKKGLAMEAVARQTRISKRYLEALEADRFDEFPALVYLRGFLKSYCEFLEVEFDPLWSQVEAATAPPPPAAPGAAAAPSAAPVTPVPATPAPAAPAPKKAASEPAKPKAPVPAPASHAPAPAAHHAPAPAAHHAPAHPAAAPGHEPSHGGGGGAAGAIAFSVVFAAGLGWYMLSHRAPSQPAPVPEPPKALQPLAPTVEPVVVVRLKDDAWLRVALDGQTVFEGRAPRGSSQEWKPAKTLTLRSTSPEALAVELNGQPKELGPAGPDGEYRIDVP